MQRNFTIWEGFVRRLSAWILAAVIGLGPALPAAAQNSEIVFQRGNWEVQVVNFTDGTYACVAQVSRGGDYFSVWAWSNYFVQLQFFSPGWSFQDGSANLQVQIDRRPVWTLTNAELTGSSVFFDISDKDTGVDFLDEVMRGSALHLSNESGQHVQSFSLAGSSASVSSLFDCVDVLAKNGY